MKTVTRILAVLFATLFVVSGTAALLFFNIERRIFDAETYKRALAVEQLHERMPGLIAQALSASASSQENTPLLIQNLGVSEWESALNALLPAGTLEALSSEAIDQVFAYLNGDADSASLSLAAIKESLASDAGVEVAMQFLRAMPDCTLEEIARITMSLFAEGQINLCNPPESIRELLKPLVKFQLQVAAQAIPDRMTIIPEATAASGEDPREGLTTIRLGMKLSPVLPLFFLLLVTVLAIRSFKDWLNWWGYPFLITGLLGVMLGSLGKPLINRVIQSLVANRLPRSIHLVIHQTIQNLTGAILKQILDPVTMQNLFLAGAGLAMVLLGYYVKRRTVSVPRGISS